ncbi:MAG: ATP-binding cassette domain-containing protein [Solirubrobacterales bacterium]|nr:ATP-binding cassette domain-containing protein [Solirubrobacterales bacterium]
MAAEPRPRASILRAERLGRHFGGLRAVDGVDLDISTGELVGIVGPNGAGKTTLFSLLSGELAPSEGQIFLDSERVTRKPVHTRARMGLGRTFQIVRPFDSMTVAENVAVCAMTHERSRRAAEVAGYEVLERLRLADRAQVPATQLTLAQRKRLEIARALAIEPRVLLLDEVMAGLNPVETDQAIEVIGELHAGGLTVLLIEHNLKVVRGLCQRMLALDHGKPIAEGTPEQVFADERVIEAYLGTRHR